MTSGLTTGFLLRKLNMGLRATQICLRLGVLSCPTPGRWPPHSALACRVVY